MSELRMEQGSVEVRRCHGLREFEACLDLERRVWGSNDIDVVPSAVFVVVAETGGQVLGAFDSAADGKLIGFTLGMPAFRGQRRYIHSHMTAVLPAYQNRGIGRMLKLFQRREAMSRGIELVEWTFDPLELRNAHFNLERLGAVVRRFLPNVYGVTTSPLHGGMPTDRLLAEWWLDSPRVRACVERAPGAAAAEGTRAAAACIEVPRNILALKESDRESALRIQARVREQFQDWLGRGYVVTGIAFGEGNARYLLEPYATAIGVPA